MICPICGAELEHEDSFGNLDFINHGNLNGKRGDIFRCPNGKEQNETCDSECFHVPGSFYTFVGSNELHEGYPC